MARFTVVEAPAGLGDAEAVAWLGRRAFGVTVDRGQTWRCSFCFQAWAVGHTCAGLSAWQRGLVAWLRGA